MTVNNIALYLKNHEKREINRTIHIVIAWEKKSAGSDDYFLRINADYA